MEFTKRELEILNAAMHQMIQSSNFILPLSHASDLRNELDKLRVKVYGLTQDGR